MGNKQTEAPSRCHLSACCRELESSSRCQARRAVTGLLYFYAALGLMVSCRRRRHSATRSLRSSTRLGSASTTTPNAMPANEQQTLLPGHAGTDEHCGNDGEQCCHLPSQHGYSPFPSGLPEQQGARWNGSLLPSVARVAKELWPGFAWKPDQHFPVSELQVASTLTCIKPCCRL